MARKLAVRWEVRRKSFLAVWPHPVKWTPRWCWGARCSSCIQHSWGRGIKAAPGPAGVPDPSSSSCSALRLRLACQAYLLPLQNIFSHFLSEIQPKSPGTLAAFSPCHSQSPIHFCIDLILKWEYILQIFRRFLIYRVNHQMNRNTILDSRFF